MTDVLHTIRLTRGQTLELTEDEVRELRDVLNRLYPPPSVLAPLTGQPPTAAPCPTPSVLATLVPQAQAPVWPPVWQDPYHGVLAGYHPLNDPTTNCYGANCHTSNQ